MSAARAGTAGDAATAGRLARATVAVLCGGTSGEREVSLDSGREVLRAPDRLDLVHVFLSRDDHGDGRLHWCCPGGM